MEGGVHVWRTERKGEKRRERKGVRVWHTKREGEKRRERKGCTACLTYNVGLRSTGPKKDSKPAMRLSSMRVSICSDAKGGLPVGWGTSSPFALASSFAFCASAFLAASSAAATVARDHRMAW